MRRTTAAAAVAAALATAGCGGSAGDLLSIRSNGGQAGDDHTLVVTGDGRGRCDGGKTLKLSSRLVIDAREVERETAPLARRAADYLPVPERRRFVLTQREGTVRWSEGSPDLPKVLPQAQLLALELRRELCPGG
jgi:hypothetical protein